MADARSWPALLLEAPDRGCNYDDIVSLVLDDYQPAAIEDLVELPVPPGGIWDPTAPLPHTAASAPLRWRVYFRAPVDRDLALAALAGQCPALRCTPVEVPDEDWAARSQRSLTAIRIGDFLIAPPWDLPAAVPPGVTCIVIEPSMGFGTGHHQSTRLCLRALSTQTLAGREVLDLGTGSGVLALAAASRGARVKALDVDPDALASAQAGAALNPGLPGVEWLVGDFRLVQMPPADVVFANLTGGLLIQAAPSIRRLVRPGGQLIVSGVLQDEVDDVRTALALTVCRRLSEDGWVALVLQHETSRDDTMHAPDVGCRSIPPQGHPTERLQYGSRPISETQARRPLRALRRPACLPGGSRLLVLRPPGGERPAGRARTARHHRGLQGDPDRPLAA